PTPRYGLCAAAANGRIYAIGGYLTTASEEYDPVRNQWRPVADLPIYSLGHPGCGVIGGKIYLAGGESGSFPIPGSLSNCLSFALEFDPLDGPEGSWTRKANMPGDLSYGIQQNGSAAIGGSLFCFSGVPVYDPGGIYTRCIEYRPATDEWFL